MLPGHFLSLGHAVGVLHKTEHEEFAAPVVPESTDALQGRQETIETAHERPDGLAEMGEHPRGGSLEDVEVSNAGGNLRNCLNGAGTRSNHGHALAGEINRRVPFGGVHDGADK